MNIKIGVAFHKEFFRFEDDTFIPIHVGSEKSNFDLDMQTDNDGLNISYKNHYYCELTGTYWLWKNVTDVDYLGLCHYRRYFSKPRFNVNYYLKKIKFFLNNKHLNDAIFLSDSSNIAPGGQLELSLNDFSRFLNKDVLKNDIDIYALKPAVLMKINVYTHFMKPSGSAPIDMLSKIVSETKPEYSDTLLKVLNGNEIIYANMVVMKNKFFHEYCDFLFSVLSEHEKQSVKSGWCMNPMEEGCYGRLPGYMGEILTSCFVLKKIDQGLNVRLLPSIFVED